MCLRGGVYKRSCEGLDEYFVAYSGVGLEVGDGGECAFKWRDCILRAFGWRSLRVHVRIVAWDYTGYIE